MSEGATTRAARRKDCIVKGEALRLARRFGLVSSGLLRIIGISNDWVSVVICPDLRGPNDQRPMPNVEVSMRDAHESNHAALRPE
jgi:hypothetical protein